MSVNSYTSSDADRLVARYNELKTARTNFENLWQDVVKFICPDRADFTVKRTVGGRRNGTLLNSVGVESAQFLAASLNGMMTDPSAKWFLLRFAGGQDLGDDWEEWLNRCNEIFWYELYSPRANFGAALNETYLDDASINTSLLYTAWNEKRNGLMFLSKTVAECVIDEDENAEINRVFRRFAFSAVQLVGAFPNFAFDEKILREAEEGKTERAYSVLHCVLPNDDKNISRPFKEIYVFEREKKILKTAYFEEFPYAVTRWARVSGEVYGRGPGISALPELSMLQDVMKSYIIAAQKAAEPPMLVNKDETFLPGATGPGGVIRYEFEKPEAFASGANFQVSEHLIDNSENKVRKMFLNDRLADVLGDRATATEVIQIVRENARVLGPIYWRQVNEKLNPCLTRAFNLCLRHGKFPPMPGDPNGIGIDIEYVSPMAQAFKYEKADRIGQAFVASAPFIQADPQSVAVFNTEKAIREIHDIYGVKDVLRSAAEVEEIRNQQAAVQQQAQNVSDAATALELQGMQNEVKQQDSGNDGQN